MTPLTYIWPENFDCTEFKKIKQVDGAIPEKDQAGLSDGEAATREMLVHEGHEPVVCRF